MIDDAHFGANLGIVRDAVHELGRDDVRIVAVTKGHGASEIERALRHGIPDVGESYAQELEAKRSVIPDDVSVHFIGRIQRNKVRRVAAAVDLWHSVDRPEVLDEIGRRRPGAGVLIQVGVPGDPAKAGVGSDELEDMLKRAETAGVEVCGLMTMGVFDDDDATRRQFEETTRLANTLGLAEVSMGMSGDYRIALAAGSTLLRLGTVLFGPRPLA